MRYLKEAYPKTKSSTTLHDPPNYIELPLNESLYSKVALKIFDIKYFGLIHKCTIEKNNNKKCNYNEKYWEQKGSVTKTVNGRETYIGIRGSYVAPYIQVKDNVLPHKAIRDLYRNTYKYKMDCSTAIMVARTYCVFKQLGKKKFNELYSNKVLSIGQSEKRTTLVVASISRGILKPFSNDLEKYQNEKLIPIGSRLIFTNLLCHEKLGGKYDYSNENFTRVEDGFLAQGINNSKPVKHLNEVKRMYAEITMKACPDEGMSIEDYMKKHIKLQSYTIYANRIPLK